MHTILSAGCWDFAHSPLVLDDGSLHTHLSAGCWEFVHTILSAELMVTVNIAYNFQAGDFIREGKVILQNSYSATNQI